ncbi:MAG: hypothetical protein P1V51_00895 [Deltaproteobacteria bacterium]|nr:hypothetical protein [Deltaproteobacteria bacterium]
MRHLLWLLPLVCILWAAPARANAPAPWWACEDKAAGDACDLYPTGTGVCSPVSGCTDNPDTHVDECLYCVEGTPRDDKGGCQTATAPGALLALLGVGFLGALALRRARVGAP